MVRSPLTAASATFALKAGVWFRRVRLLMVSPDSRDTACPLSGRNSTCRPVQISGTGSERIEPLPPYIDPELLVEGESETRRSVVEHGALDAKFLLVEQHAGRQQRR